jgi:hypothetical protein
MTEEAASLPFVPTVDVAVLIIHPTVVAKIRDRHSPLTAEDVREAVLYARDTTTGWDPDETHGLRLVVRGRTYAGAEFIAYLMPLNENDPEEGTFILKTAIPIPAI